MEIKDKSYEQQVKGNSLNAMHPCSQNMSMREIEILGYLYMDFTSAQIAGMMFVTLDSVESDIKNILEKYKVSNIQEIASLYKDSK